MPRFVPASVAELQRVGLFGALSGEQLGRLADDSERVELPPGAAFGSTETTVDVLLTGLARGAEGMLRPGDTASGPATAVTACVLVRCDRETLEALVGS
jgi:hypothetical protein